MSIIKPGKVAFRVGVERREAKESAKDSSKFVKNIWDDYAAPKKAHKKKEYFPDTQGRMIPAEKKLKVAFTKDEKAAEQAANDGIFQVEPAQVFRRDYSALQEALKYTFQDQTLLERALTHRSALSMKDRADYERLEFLGDAVLDLGIAHLLSDRHPNAREGELSKMRAALVNTQTLADVARILQIGGFIRLGRGEMASGGFERPSILADVMEAIIGAIYRDSSFDAALKIVEGIFDSMLDQVKPSDPKTELQEILHAAGSEPPSYLLEMMEGPEHAPTFVTVVIVDNEIAGRGRGTTKKAAQQAAAAEALARMSLTAKPLSLVEGQNVFLSEAFLVPAKQEELATPTDQEAA